MGARQAAQASSRLQRTRRDPHAPSDSLPRMRVRSRAPIANHAPSTLLAPAWGSTSRSAGSSSQLGSHIQLDGCANSTDCIQRSLSASDRPACHGQRAPRTSNTPVAAVRLTREVDIRSRSVTCCSAELAVPPRVQSRIRNTIRIRATLANTMSWHVHRHSGRFRASAPNRATDQPARCGRRSHRASRKLARLVQATTTTGKESTCPSHLQCIGHRETCTKPPVILHDRPSQNAGTCGTGRRGMRVMLSTHGSRGNVEPIMEVAAQLGALGG